MPRTQQSNIEKEAVKVMIEKILGTMKRPDTRRPDWLITEDTETSLFLTFARIDLLFYDLKYSDLETWSTYTNSFVLFLAGSSKEVYIVPVSEIHYHIVQEERWLVDDGSYKIHLIQNNLMKIQEFPKLDLMLYHNHFALLGESEIVCVPLVEPRNIDRKSPPLQSGKKGILTFEVYEQNKQYIDKLCNLLIELRSNHTTMQYAGMSRSLIKELSNAQRQILLYLSQPNESAEEKS